VFLCLTDAVDNVVNIVTQFNVEQKVMWEGVVQNDIAPKSSLMLCEFASRFYFSNKVFK
jgi:hypothetical protein